MQRKAIIEECARVCDAYAASRSEIRDMLSKADNPVAAGNFGMEFLAARYLAAAIRALTNEDPEGVPR